MNANHRAIVGGVVWVAFLALTGPHLLHENWAHALLLLAALVLFPLALELTDDPKDPPAAARLIMAARLLQLPAAFLLAGSFLRPAGDGATLAATPWVILCGVVATAGWQRMRKGGYRRPFERICGDVAFLFLGIGGAWTFADRAAYQPLHFAPAIVTLTAVHFHFAGLLLPLFAGLVVRALPDSRLASRGAVGTILGVPAVAMGITATQLGWGPAFETAAGCGLALAGLVIAVLHVRLAATPGRTPATRALLGLAGASLFFGMGLAVLYAMRSAWFPVPWLDLAWMRALHGTANALGFGLCGVLAWGRVAAGR